MKLILTQDVPGLGTPGDVVEVKDGYGRNYLLPRKLATAWSRGAQVQIEAIRKARAARALASQDDAVTQRSALQSRVFPLSVRAGTGGRLFGSVTPGDIADAIVAAGGPQLDRRMIRVATPIKTTGTHKVTVSLHSDVTATLTLEVAGT